MMSKPVVGGRDALKIEGELNAGILLALVVSRFARRSRWSWS